MSHHIVHSELGTIEVRRPANSRHYRLRVVGYRHLIVSAPKRASQHSIERFVEKNRSWIGKQSLWQQLQFEHGVHITPTHRLLFNPINSVRINSRWAKQYLEIQLPAAVAIEDCRVQRYVYDTIIKRMRADAKRLLIPVARRLAQTHQIAVSDIRIKNSTSRWGSYSSLANLNLNLQLMRLGEDLRQHVIVHELCHGRVMSHAPEFWSELQRMRPDFRQERKLLRSRQIWRRPPCMD